eukprot:CAMPEP_0113311100 /NCGR_PEP_ID=MMETSP0010_2-20120614/8475_1 /TAXON_ID=216773 ORGANISM="Corethron hystrix, Strain 308" /NCGR_SAMPLE_ID=MMETSP0010_2 /ASSEMBLY_ACC=CAM_ASM_000155 /LENGTH=350 /DNA_ID=CAMNT_0000166677 /DNA_START=393 /DNA_END=1445 /DNA_ORIENTATION=+ /assembly_acc=CAM_ASM_000155
MSPEAMAAMDSVIAKVSAQIPDQPKTQQMLSHFIQEYFVACDVGGQPSEMTAEKIASAIQFGMKYGMGEDKYTFGVSHEALREPFDYYTWGCDFFRPTMDLSNSVVLGDENLKEAFRQVAAGENVVFLANHQSEADPQVFSLLLEKVGLGEEAAQVRYIAGHKVTTDPLAIPFSMGRNLLCIHSKKHIDADPETKPAKQKQNLQTMSAMLKIMRKGGASLWVAPSGGRDRRDVSVSLSEPPSIPIAPFDSKTVDMFRLMGNKSKVPTHFYPLAMVSYELCPPPDTIEAGVGERRNVRYSPIGIAVGKEVPNVGGLECRHAFTEHAQEEVQGGYKQLVENIRENVPFRCAA